MGARGPAPKPALRVVKQGNPGKKAKAEIDRQIVFPPGAPAEPDWSAWFPGDDDSNVLARSIAESTWQAKVPYLDAQGYLAEIDLEVLTDLCVSQARLLQLEREISIAGVAVEGERGTQKHPAVTAANQYRTHLRSLWAVLYLTPAARARANGNGGASGQEGDDPFD